MQFLLVPFLSGGCMELAALQIPILHHPSNEPMRQPTNQVDQPDLTFS